MSIGKRELAQLIKEFIRERPMSLQAIARGSGVSYMTVHNIVNPAISREPKPKSTGKILDFLKAHSGAYDDGRFTQLIKAIVGAHDEAAMVKACTALKEYVAVNAAGDFDRFVRTEVRKSNGVVMTGGCDGIGE